MSSSARFAASSSPGWLRPTRFRTVSLHLLIQGADARMLAKNDLAAIAAAKQAARNLLAAVRGSRRGTHCSRWTRK